MIELPLFSTTPSYRYTVEIESVVYMLQFHFNDRMGRWIMDILTPSQVVILAGIPMLTDTDLIGRFQNKALPPGYFLVVDNTGKHRNPDFDNFGTDVKLYYLTQQEAFA